MAGGRLFSSIFYGLWVLILSACRTALPGFGPPPGIGRPRINPLAFLLSAWLFFGWYPLLERSGPLSFLWFAFLLPLACFDLRYRKVPNRLLLLLLLGRLYLAAEACLGRPPPGAGGSRELLLLLFRLALISAAGLVTRSAVGAGDIKLLLLLALFVSGGELLLGVFLAVAAAWPVALLLLWRSGRNSRPRLPFVPFLLFGSLGARYIYLFWGLHVS